MKKYLSDIWKRRELILYLVTSGLKAQHRNTFLGYFWWLLDPLLGIFIYYFVVVILFKRGGDDYGLYLVIGMVAWRWVDSTINNVERSIHSQARLITDIYLPKIIFPVGSTLTQIINFGFGLCIIAIFLIILRRPVGIEVVWLPFVMVMQLFFMMAISFPVAYVGVFVRDLDNIVKHLLRLWFFGSPIIWPEEMIPKVGRVFLEINPITHFLRDYRKILMYNEAPDFMTILYIGVASLFIIVFIVYFYSKNEHRIIKSL